MTTKTGIELSRLKGQELVDRKVADECLAALAKHGVVIYRYADIDDADLVAFSRLLGDVVQSGFRSLW